MEVVVIKYIVVWSQMAVDGPSSDKRGLADANRGQLRQLLPSQNTRVVSRGWARMWMASLVMPGWCNMWVLAKWHVGMVSGADRVAGTHCWGAQVGLLAWFIILEPWGTQSSTTCTSMMWQHAWMCEVLWGTRGE